MIETIPEYFYGDAGPTWVDRSSLLVTRDRTSDVLPDNRITLSWNFRHRHLHAVLAQNKRTN